LEANALLCDHAQVSADHKLYLSGGNVTRLWSARAEPPLVVTVGLAVIVHIGWQETNQAHRLGIELVFDDVVGAQRVHLPVELTPSALPGTEGMVTAEFNVGRAPEMIPGEATLMPIALNFPGLALPAPGSYFFTIGIDGTEVSRVPFRAMVIPQLQGVPRQ
jgi:hypothetical protein